MINKQGKKTPYTKADLINEYHKIVADNKRGDKERAEILLRVIENMFEDAVYYARDTKKGFNVGEIVECHVNSRVFKERHVANAKAGSNDFEFKGHVYEIKLTTSSTHLCSPIRKIEDTIFITRKGCYLIDKATIQKLYDEFSDKVATHTYVKTDSEGVVRLKEDAIKLGKVLKDVNRLFGF